MEKGDSIHFANNPDKAHYRKLQPDVAKKERKKLSSLSDSKEAFCLNTKM